MNSIPFIAAYMTEPPEASFSQTVPKPDAQSVLDLLEVAIDARAELMDERRESALRLFNGFYEGCPELVIDLYARTAIIFNYAHNPTVLQPVVRAVQEYLFYRFPWLNAVILKLRKAPDPQQRRGIILAGEKPDLKIREHGVWYAIDPLISQDAGFYLDTRGLRAWAIQNSANRRVLNTFAYTGSLGVAARAGGAIQVVQMDRNRHYLNLAKASYSLNGFDIDRGDFLCGDFWVLVGRLKRADRLFDCVFIDPPFFSASETGRVDLIHHPERVINKVRPLVCHNGYLIVVNNALFFSGAEYMSLLEKLCASGYLSIETLIPVPPDVTGYPHTCRRPPPVDPSPFNHPTKIAVLRVRRKDERCE